MNCRSVYTCSHIHTCRLSTYTHRGCTRAAPSGLIYVKVVDMTRSNAVRLLSGGPGRGIHMSLGLELVGTIREVGAEESAPDAQSPTLKRLRSSHHMAARLLAEGKRPTDVALMVGYSLSRISILQRDPSFQELVAHYAARHTEVIEDFSQTAEALARDAMQEVHDRVLDDPEGINTITMLEIAKTAAAHAGLGPITRSLNVNVQRNWGDQLDAAKARRERLAAQATVLEPAQRSERTVLEPASGRGPTDD